MLPIEKSKKELELSRKTIGIYGRPGIGKSSLASYFEGGIFGATEAGLGHMNVHKVDIVSWDKPLEEKDGRIIGGFLPFCADIIGGKHEFKTIIIDTFENLCKLCTEWKCTELDISDIGSYKRYGAHHLVTEEIDRVIRKLVRSPYGLILISHFKQEIIKRRSGDITRATLTIGGANKQIMLNYCDPLLFMDSEIRGDKEVGVIRTKPSIYWEAKDKNRFLPEYIEYSLDNPEEACKQVVESFKKGE